MSTDPRELYRLWIDELWNGDSTDLPTVAEQLVADDFVGHWPDQEIEGRDALVDLIAETKNMIDGLTFRIELGPLADGDLVAGRWTGRGSADATTFLGNDILRVADGRFAEYWVASMEIDTTTSE